jgi:hypothetical protein
MAPIIASIVEKNIPDGERNPDPQRLGTFEPI